MHTSEVCPDLRDCISVSRDTDDNADSHSDQAESENRINTADDRIDGNKCCDEIVGQDNCKPYGCLCERARNTLLCEKLDQKTCRTYCEYSTDHDQKNN